MQGVGLASNIRMIKVLSQTEHISFIFRPLALAPTFFLSSSDNLSPLTERDSKLQAKKQIKRNHISAELWRRFFFKTDV